MQADADILAGQQREVGIGDGGARRDRAGRAVDRVVEEGELALVARLGLARQQHLGLDLPGRARLLDLGEIGLARVEGHVDRVELHQRVERACRRR